MVLKKEDLEDGFSDDALFNKDDEFVYITDEHKNFIAFCKEKINNSELPKDFAQWTTRRQFTYLMQNISRYFPNIPESLRFILPAIFKPGDCGRPANERPDWLDMAKFHRGQKFALRYFSTISISHMIALLHTFSFMDGLKILILSQKSNTPYRAFKRYLSTVNRIRNWYRYDPWCENSKAHRDIQMVRRLHLAMREKICKMDDKEIDRASKIPQPFCPIVGTVVKDFTNTCPMACSLQNPYTMFRAKYLNQGDMSAVQFSFISLIVLYPEHFGVHDACEEDLEAFCHMWRGLGYLCGIEDQYNFCNGSLQDVRQRCRDFTEYWVKTNFRMIGSEWEHMSMCVFEGMSYIIPIKLSYKVLLYWLCNLYKLNMPHLYKTFYLWEKISYNLLFTLRYLIKVPGVLRIMNAYIHMCLDRATKFKHNVHIKLMQRSSKLVSESIVNMF